MMTAKEAKEIIEHHIGGDVTLNGNRITVDRELTAKEYLAVQNRIDYKCADLSGDSATFVIKKQLHLISHYETSIGVMAASKEEAMEKAEEKHSGLGDYYHQGTESEIKGHLEDNEVVIL